MFLKHLISACAFLIVAGTALINGAPQGFVEGHLKIIELKEVDLAGPAGSRPSKPIAENYAEYPLIILGEGGKKEVARLTADKEGNYRIALPPGDYILDVAGRGQRHLRAEPQPFTIVSNQTLRVEMNIDTGIR